MDDKEIIKLYMNTLVRDREVDRKRSSQGSFHVVNIDKRYYPNALYDRFRKDANKLIEYLMPGRTSDKLYLMVDIRDIYDKFIEMHNINIGIIKKKRFENQILYDQAYTKKYKKLKEDTQKEIDKNKEVDFDKEFLETLVDQRFNIASIHEMKESMNCFLAQVQFSDSSRLKKEDHIFISEYLWSHQPFTEYVYLAIFEDRYYHLANKLGYIKAMIDEKVIDLQKNNGNFDKLFFLKGYEEDNSR